MGQENRGTEWEDVENPSGTITEEGTTTSKQQQQPPRRRRIAHFVGILVAIAAILGLTLGLVFGLRDGNDSPSPSSSTSNNIGSNNDGGLLSDEGDNVDNTPPDTLPAVEDNKPVVEPTLEDEQQDATPSPTENVPGKDVDEPADSLDNSEPVLPPPLFDDTISTPTIEFPEQESIPYYRSVGPLLAHVKMVSPSIAKGYATCSDLEKDISDALKHYANRVILEQAANGEYYATCDPNDPYWYDRYRYNYGYNYSSYGYDYYNYNYPKSEENTTSSTSLQEEDEHENVFHGASENTRMSPPHKRNIILPSGHKRSNPHASGNKKNKLNASGPDAKDSTEASAIPEDSFHANNVVDGVDDADIVKSDGRYVFAAYGDVLYAWEASDGTTGHSVTTIPGNESDCSFNYYDYSYGYDYEDYDYSQESSAQEGDSNIPSSPFTSRSGNVEKKKSHDPNRRRTRGGEAVRKRNSAPHGRNTKQDSGASSLEPCTYRSKPRIIGLLLNGDRLTAIVSEDTYTYYYWYGYAENYTYPIIDDYSILSVRVYDITSVPMDGSPLVELGYHELYGSYYNGRSINETALIVTSTYINTYIYAESLYRYQPQYCGLNTSAYTELAAETAAKNLEPFAKQMVEELQLGSDCSHIFQISMMQEPKDGTNATGEVDGNDMPDLTSGNLLGQFVQLTSFNMSSDFGVDGIIPASVSGTFAQGDGWLSSVYVTENFVGVMTNGYFYDYETGTSYSNTYVLGFNTATGIAIPFCLGKVPGSLVNQYAVDKWDGHLRIATSDWIWNDMNFTYTTSNKIFELLLPGQSDGPVMDVVGETEHLGNDYEFMLAVRFFEDKAYVVTYGQSEPFFIVDLSNHTNPRAIGELEVPGMSTYLQRIMIDGVTYILSIGQDWNQTDWSSSLKLTLFNITDEASPTVAADYLDDGAYSTASWDFKSIRYLPESNKLIIPRSKYTCQAEGNFDGFVSYNISATEITPHHNISHTNSSSMYGGCWYDAYMQPRSLVFQSKLTTILAHRVVNSDMETGEINWDIDLDVRLNKSHCESYNYYQYVYSYGYGCGQNYGYHYGYGYGGNDTYQYENETETYEYGY